MFHTIFATIHIMSASSALCFGFLVLCERKGTAFHRMIGIAYALAMIMTNLASFALYGLLGHVGPFHALAALSLYCTLRGVMAAIRRSRHWLTAHYYWMAWSYIGLLAAATVEALIRVPALQDFTRTPMRAIVASLLVTAVFNGGGWILIPRGLQRRAMAGLALDIL